ncbi:MAG TPA: hypothetical protein PKD58_07350, partial [Candidatus Sumerlaeota bacterium]|nr:hypothetical protein [Candidatus Sumerlaeota bacterium]
MTALQKPGKYALLGSMVLLSLLTPALSFASEAEIELPDMGLATFSVFGQEIAGRTMLLIGLVICILGGLFGI